MSLNSLWALLQQWQKLRILQHGEGTTSCRGRDLGVCEQRLHLLQELVGILRATFQNLIYCEATPFLLEFCVILFRRDVLEEVELVGMLLDSPTKSTSILVLCRFRPANFCCLVEDDGPLFSHLPQLAGKLQGSRQGCLVAFRRDATRACNAKAFLAVHSSQLVVHHAGIGLLEPRKACFVCFCGFSAKLLRMDICGHLVIGFFHGFLIKAVHICLEHLEEVCPVL
mmetsp:Transcript_81817/g.144420  ORF Transcript_81817/g.144420 Transcript_81817/m.144420 type:complete len:226 (-) Transcript_81817:412-1089(-)